MKLVEVVNLSLKGDSDFIVCDQDTGEIIFDDTKSTTTEFSQFISKNSGVQVFSIEATTRHRIVIYVQEGKL